MCRSPEEGTGQLSMNVHGRAAKGRQAVTKDHTLCASVSMKRPERTNP